MRLLFPLLAAFFWGSSPVKAEESPDLGRAVMLWENLCFKREKLTGEIENFQRAENKGGWADLEEKMRNFEENREKLRIALDNLAKGGDDNQTQWALRVKESPEIKDFERLRENWRKLRASREKKKAAKKRLLKDLKKIKGELASREEELKRLTEEFKALKESFCLQEKESEDLRRKTLEERELLNKTLCAERSQSAKLRLDYDNTNKRVAGLEKQLDTLTNSLIGKQREIEEIKMRSDIREEELKRQITGILDSHAKERRQKEVLINSFIEQLEGFKGD